MKIGADRISHKSCQKSILEIKLLIQKKTISFLFQNNYKKQTNIVFTLADTIIKYFNTKKNIFEKIVLQNGSKLGFYFLDRKVYYVSNKNLSS